MEKISPGRRVLPAHGYTVKEDSVLKLPDRSDGADRRAWDTTVSSILISAVDPLFDLLCLCLVQDGFGPRGSRGRILIKAVSNGAH